MDTSNPKRKKRGAGRRAGVWGWDEGRRETIIFIGKSWRIWQRHGE